MKQSDVMKTARWSLRKCRYRLPCRPYDVIMSDAFDPSNAVIQAMRSNFGHFNDGGLIVLAGEPGIGKTVAAVFYSCLRTSTTSPTFGDEVNEHTRHPDLWFVTGPLILANGYDKKEVPLGMKPGNISNLYGVMITDDMGKEHMKLGWTMKKVWNFFNHRYSNKLPTIATTNIETWDEFVNRYGPGLEDRFREWGRWIYVEGESLR